MAAQFLRLYGYPKGQQSAANTMGSVIAEGLRKATHIGHLTQPPQIEVFTNPNSPIEHGVRSPMVRKRTLRPFVQLRWLFQRPQLPI